MHASLARPISSPVAPVSVVLVSAECARWRDTIIWTVRGRGHHVQTVDRDAYAAEEHRSELVVLDLDVCDDRLREILRELDSVPARERPDVVIVSDDPMNPALRILARTFGAQIRPRAAVLQLPSMLRTMRNVRSQTPVA